MLLVALSDAYIPDRAIDIPLKFKNLLSIPDKISHIALLGNSTQSTEFLSFLTQISPDISIIRGEFDNPKITLPIDKTPENENNSKDKKITINNNDSNKDELPLTSVIKIGNFRIGCCSGYTLVPKNDPFSLLILARQLDVDILLWGGTHNVEAYTLEGKFFVNPGSCTGAFNSDWPITNDLKTTSDQNTLDTTTIEETNESKESTTNGEGTEESLKGDTSEKEEEQEINEEDIEIPDSVITGSNTPSFCLLDIQGSTCTLYIYIYIDGDVRVDKVVYQKDDGEENDE